MIKKLWTACLLGAFLITACDLASPPRKRASKQQRALPPAEDPTTTETPPATDATVEAPIRATAQLSSLWSSRPLRPSFLSPAQASDVIVAELGERRATLAYADLVLRNIKDSKGLERYLTRGQREFLTQEIISVWLLADEARTRGLGEHPELKLRDKVALVEAIQQKHFEDAIPSDEALLKHIEANPTRFVKPERRQAMILVMRDLDALKKIHAEAVHSLPQPIEARAAAFKTLIDQHSDDSTTQRRGGKLPWINVGGAGIISPVFREQIETLSPGDLSAPVKTGDAWATLMLVDVIPSQPIALDDVREKLTRQLQTIHGRQRFDEQNVQRRREVTIKQNLEPLARLRLAEDGSKKILVDPADRDLALLTVDDVTLTLAEAAVAMETRLVPDDVRAVISGEGAQRMQLVEALITLTVFAAKHSEEDVDAALLGCLRDRNARDYLIKATREETFAAFEPSGYYEQHRDIFLRPEQRTFVQLVSADKKSAQRHRDALMSRFPAPNKERQRALRELAKVHSLDAQSAGRDGLLPRVALEETPLSVPIEVRRAGFALQKPYEVSEPFQVGARWHLVMLDRVHPAGGERYEDVRLDVRRHIDREHVSAAVKQLQASLLNTASPILNTAPLEVIKPPRRRQRRRRPSGLRR